MKAFIALVRREFIEHRGAFRTAPMYILGILTFIVIGTLLFRANASMLVGVAGFSSSIFAFAFAGFAWLWWIYLLCILVLYFPESFSADNRNNSMLFWKSMPQSDFKVLLSKFVAGITVLPFCIFVATLATGVIIYGVTLIGTLQIAGLNPLVMNPAEDAYNYLQVAGGALVFYGLGLLWFVPFFAWAAALGTIFGRWAVPIGFVIPAAIGLAEYLILGSKHFSTALWARMDYAANIEDFSHQIEQGGGLDFVSFIRTIWTQVDLLSLGLGWAFALVMVFLASEYRRRVTAN